MKTLKSFTKPKALTVFWLFLSIPFEKTSDNYRFSASVAGFGMLLRDSKFKENLTYSDVLEWTKRAKGKDKNGDRAEFIRMVKTCELLAE